MNEEKIRFQIIDKYFTESKNPLVNFAKRFLGMPVTKWDFLRQELNKECILSKEIAP